MSRRRDTAQSATEPRVRTEPLRRRYEELRDTNGLTLDDVAAAAGAPDANAVAGQLGLRPRRGARHALPYEQAAPYLKALGMGCLHHVSEQETYLRVPNAPLRRRYEELRDLNGLSLDTVAASVGLSDGTAVARDLGLRPNTRGTVKHDLGYDRAVSYAQALSAPYSDVGV